METKIIMSEPLTQDEYQAVPANFGDGWLTKSAQDLCKIVIMFGGFDAAALVLAIHEIHKGTGLANVTTVTNALQNLYDDARQNHPEWYEESEKAHGIAHMLEREKLLGA
jgi:hypothetical protein